MLPSLTPSSQGKNMAKALGPDLAGKSESRKNGHTELLLQSWTKLLGKIKRRRGRRRWRGRGKREWIMKRGQYFPNPTAWISSLLRQPGEQGENTQRTDVVCNISMCSVPGPLANIA